MAWGVVDLIGGILGVACAAFDYIAFTRREEDKEKRRLKKELDLHRTLIGVWLICCGLQRFVK